MLAVAQAEKEEVLLGLQNAMLKMKVLWMDLDCRQYLDLVSSIPHYLRFKLLILRNL